MTDAEAIQEAVPDRDACMVESAEVHECTWFCTRPRGHTGEHIACCKGFTRTDPEDPDEVVARWPNEIKAALEWRHAPS